MYIISSLASKNLGAKDPNEKESCCNLQRVALYVDLIASSLIILGMALALLTTRNVNLGPLNAISVLNFYQPQFVMSIAAGIIVIDVLLVLIQTKITKLLKEIHDKEQKNNKFWQDKIKEFEDNAETAKKEATQQKSQNSELIQQLEKAKTAPKTSQEANQLKAQNNDLSNKLTVANQKIDELTQNHTRDLSEMKSVQEANDELKIELNQLEQRILKLNKENALLKQQAPQASQSNGEIDTLKQEIETLKETLKKAKQQFLLNRKQLEEKERSEQNINQQRLKLEAELKADRGVLGKIKQDFKDVEEAAVKQAQESFDCLKTSAEALRAQSQKVVELSQQVKQLENLNKALETELSKQRSVKVETKTEMEFQSQKELEQLKKEAEALKQEKARLEKEKKALQESGVKANQNEPTTTLKASLYNDKSKTFVREIASQSSEEWSVDEYENALSLVEVFQDWKQAVINIWLEDGFNLSNRAAESLISQFLENQFKSISLSESRSQFSKNLVEFQALFKAFLITKLEEWKTAVSSQKSDQNVYKELLSSVGNVAASNSIIKTDSKDSTLISNQKELVDQVHEDSIENVNKRYLKWLTQQLTDMRFSSDEIKYLLEDHTFIPMLVSSNREIFTEELYYECLERAKIIQSAEIILRRIEENRYANKDIEEFNKLFVKIPFTFRKDFSERFNTNRNTFLLEVASSEFFLARKNKNSIMPVLNGKKTLFQPLLNLGLDIQPSQEDVARYQQVLQRFKKELWMKRISPSEMTQLIEEAFIQMLILSPDVQKELEKRRESPEFIQKVLNLKDSNISAQILAAMLIQVRKGDSPYGVIEMHRVLAKMLSKMPSIGQNLLNNHYRFVLIPPNMPLTSVYGFDDLQNKNTFDGRSWSNVRGIGGHQYKKDGYTYVGVGEETLLGGKYQGKKGYELGFSTAAHEFWHAIYRGGLEKAKKIEIEKLLKQKKEKINKADKNHTVYNGWKFTTGEDSKCSYAGSNDDEWGAEFATAFLEANGGLDEQTKTRVATKEQLKKMGIEEREMFKIYAEILGESTTIPYANLEFN